MNKQDFINKIRKLVKEQGCKLLEVHWIDLDKRQCIITAKPPKLTEPFKPTAYMVFPKYGVDLLAPSYGAYAYGFQEIKLEDAILHWLVLYPRLLYIPLITLLKNIDRVNWKYLIDEASRYGNQVNTYVKGLYELIHGKAPRTKLPTIDIHILKDLTKYNIKPPKSFITALRRYLEEHYNANEE